MTSGKKSMQPSNSETQNFVNAIKTIINVPKNAVSPKSDARKLDDKYEEWKCPDCGVRYVTPTKHTHEK